MVLIFTTYYWGQTSPFTVSLPTRAFLYRSAFGMLITSKVSSLVVGVRDQCQTLFQKNSYVFIKLLLYKP